jgi:hypothetical protein
VGREAAEGSPRRDAGDQVSERDGQCFKCTETDASSELRKCPVCHKIVCEDHAYVMSGRPFCSPGCAQYFFFSDPDD